MMRIIGFSAPRLEYVPQCILEEAGKNPVDPDPQPCAGVYRGHPVEARSDHGLERVESSWVDLFWRLMRRYGYWGLAYLEALLR